MTKTYELLDDRTIMADVDEKHHMATVSVYILDELVEAVNKTGHWIWCVGSHKCSNCEEYTCFSHKELLKYCPNCGARMVEPQEREE